MALARLTDEQVEELKDLIDTEIDCLEDMMTRLDDGDPAHVESAHRVDVLADILEELEIA